MSKLELEKVRHAGKYIACNDRQEVIAAEWSQDRARTKAIIQGDTCPVVIYCPPLKPDLRNEKAMTRVALNAIQKLKKMPGVVKAYTEIDVDKAEKVLQCLYDSYEKHGRDKKTHDLVEQSRINRA
jgi:hypothetical protein